jgi:hypothetical protein
MPLAAAILPLLQGPTNQKYGLYIDSLNVRPFTRLDSIELTEAGPGDVSSLTFVIEDPTAVIPLPAAGATVLHWDQTLDAPLFSGYVNDYSVRVMGVGRTITVNAAGLETLLDWIAIPSTTPRDPVTGLLASDGNPAPVGNVLSYLVTTTAQDSDGRTDLYGPVPAGVGTANGNATYPIGILNAPGPFFADVTSVGVPVGPGSLRAGLEDLIKAAHYGTFLDPSPYIDAVVTVDFYRRLRVFLRSGRPDDWTDMTINDTVAGPQRSESINYEVHPADVVRSVYVNGSGAGQGWVTDGSGIFGRQAVIDSPTSTTAKRMEQVGALYLATQKALVRGTLTISDWTPPNATVHPSSTITITDAQVSLTAQTYAIAEIRKTFNGAGKQNWEIVFGGRRPSYVEQSRVDFVVSNDIITQKISGTRGN